MSGSEDAEGLWVRSEVMPDGTYGVAVNVGADRVWPLDREQAVAYAVACYARATEAEHDAAVFGLLTRGVGMDRETAAAFLVHDLRPDRPENHTATEPVQYLPSVGERGPFLRMFLDGAQVGEMSCADLRDHAAAALNCLAAADLDAAAHRALTGSIGLDDARAREFVSSLAEYWPEQGVPRGVPS